ncbi:choice-of-anchor J domain-containing protein [Chryseobacterium sp. L7]|uniref:Choice-of-anchor J domain-containing protein n=1 Tax=Chryseobacterium endalhagicum TaxID=2797638 RepID=A0ABS1QF80_9FLAO|nr:choice-of-anchor J domain-containing protein [Chryseobacterium endalhagicum]MBL1220976.1 choice-of-anchor J domain-containing protein [Chryseobacterium endalhagicum]
MKQIYRLAIVLGLLPASVFGQYTQSFDSATMPADWTIINGGDPGGWEAWAPGSSSLVDSHSGSHFLGLQYGSTAHDDYAVSPAITVTAGVSDKLSFWSRNKGAGLAEEFDIKVSTTTPTAAGLTNTLASALTPPTTWTQYTYDLTPYIGQTIYIAFYSTTEDVWFIGIDDFVISGNMLGVSEAKQKTVSMYPNPVIDVLNIDSKNKMSEINIYDMTGKLQKQEKVNSESAKINLTELRTGSYIVRIKEGNSEKSHKIIKK